MRVATATRPRAVIGVRPDAQMLGRTSLWPGCDTATAPRAGVDLVCVRWLRNLALGVATVTVAGCGGSPGRAGPPPAAWVVLRHLPGVVDLAGPRSDGSFLVAAAGRLLVLGRDGTVSPFARGAGGYLTAAGTEPYAHQQRSGPGDPLLVRERYGLPHRAGGATRCHHDQRAGARPRARESRWLIPTLVPCAALSLPGAPSCRPPGIPGAGFVLAQEFEGVMT
jgi:hypothetical protein